MIKETENFYSKITFVIIFGLVIILSFKIAASFLIAILVGGLLAQALWPLQQNGIFKKMKPSHTACLLVFGLTLIFVFPLALFVISLIRQAIQFKSYLAFHETLSFQSLIESINKWPLVSSFTGDSAQFQNQIKIWIAELGNTTSSNALKLAREIPFLLIQTIFSLLTCFVFLTEGKRFTAWLSDKIPLKAEIKRSLLLSFNHSSTYAVWSSLSASGTQALAIFISFSILNVPAAFLATAATFIFNFIPIIGAAPAWIIGAIYLYWQGAFIKLSFLIVFAIVTSLLENIVRVFILKGPHGLPPLVGLVAVFGGIQVFGFFGVLIGPIIVALFITMCEVWPQVWEN